ncbi:MAG: NAD(P)-binding protein, partial [Victivallales bacterium]|nr:NAD(P)-binding protein [Victivallales bacterium]
MHVDVLIIGAGLSGLSAGIRLAHFGKKVAIFERHRLPGGLNSYYHRNGVSIDVGLHAMTNYAAEDVRSAPLNKLLRQLRLKRASLGLCPQTFSKIMFPGAELRLENGLQAFMAAVSERFPDEAEGFKALCQRIAETDSMSLVPIRESTRTILAQYLKTPLLREMLLCPVMFYGNPRMDDMDFGQFCIMFQSLIMEGMARPHDGME